MGTSAGTQWNNGKICSSAGSSLDLGGVDGSVHKSRKNCPHRQHMGAGQLGEMHRNQMVKTRCSLIRQHW